MGKQENTIIDTEKASPSSFDETSLLFFTEQDVQDKLLSFLSKIDHAEASAITNDLINTYAIYLYPDTTVAHQATYPPSIILDDKLDISADANSAEENIFVTSDFAMEIELAVDGFPPPFELKKDVISTSFSPLTTVVYSSAPKHVADSYVASVLAKIITSKVASNVKRDIAGCVEIAERFERDKREGACADNIKKREAVRQKHYISENDIPF